MNFILVTGETERSDPRAPSLRRACEPACISGTTGFIYLAFSGANGEERELMHINLTRHTATINSFV